MAVLLSRQLSRKLYPVSCRSFFSQTAVNAPYWHAKFPDGLARSFEEIPLIKEISFDPKEIHQVSMEWFKKYGHVGKRYASDTTFCVDLFHFEDFWTVYHHDGEYPIRKSHRVMKQYREERKDLYDNIGLGAGEREEWWELRQMMPYGVAERLYRPLQSSLEDVADDLVKMLHIKANEGEIDMLPWLFRWAFESIFVVALNKRVGALDEKGCEEADRMVDAAGITNAMIAFSETDYTNYNEYYERLVPVQDYMYNVIVRYIEEVDSDPNSDCIVKKLLEAKNSKKNAVTLIMDMIQGALQTVPLTVLMGLYNLALNQHVQVTARKELEKVMPDRDSKYFYAARSPMPPYIRNIILETLRINPPIIGNGRIIQHDLILGGYMVPAGNNVLLHNQVACLQEENFEEPLKFKPERHPNEHVHSIELIFGAKKRTCFGKAFAFNQMGLVFSKILRDFELAYTGGEIKMINRLHNEPEKPLYLKLSPLV